MTSNNDDVIILEDDDDENIIQTEISVSALNKIIKNDTNGSKRFKADKSDKSDEESNDTKNIVELTDSTNEDSNHHGKKPFSKTSKTNKKIKLEIEVKSNRNDQDEKYDFSSPDLEMAATASRLPFEKITIEEAQFFEDLINEENKNHIKNYKLFLYIRNKIVKIKNFLN